MNAQDKKAFEHWVSVEDKHDGVFGNNNNFTRDEWIAKKTWAAACEYKNKSFIDGSKMKEMNDQIEDLLIELESIKDTPIYYKNVVLEEEIDRQRKEKEYLLNLFRSCLVFIEGWEQSYNSGEETVTGKEVRSVLREAAIDKVCE